MNLPASNLEHLLKIYYYGTAAVHAAEFFGTLVRENNKPALARILRDYRVRPIHQSQEIELRASVDRLLNCCSALEIAELAGFVTDVRGSEFARSVRPIIEEPNVQRYYCMFYPQKLPQLFRLRLANAHRTTARNAGTLDTPIEAFFELDRRFMANLEDGTFLRMLDDFQIDGFWLGDVIDLIGEPKQFIDHLTMPPIERDARSDALAEFTQFMDFCFELKRVLEALRPWPLVRSAVWHHYGYWFQIMRAELRSQLGEALRQFLHWQPTGEDEASGAQLQAYVIEANATLNTLTSRNFARPVGDLLNRVSRT